MSASVTPYPLNPNISCVERVRKLFCEIVKRRLITMARQRPEELTAVSDWILDIQLNTLPTFILTDAGVRDVWNTANAEISVRDFLFSLCFEMRQRCFETEDDYIAYLDVVASSTSQFNDKYSVIDEATLGAISTVTVAKNLLGGNPWLIPILLFEQFTSTEFGLDIALSEQETAADGKPETPTGP